MSSTSKQATIDPKAPKKSRTARGKRLPPPTTGEVLVEGIAMGIVITSLNRVGSGLAGLLAKHPLALFSTGFITGFLTHKYRKEIIGLSYNTAAESKNFVLRQKEHLDDFLADLRQDGDQTPS